LLTDDGNKKQKSTWKAHERKMVILHLFWALGLLTDDAFIHILL
jgi:hypothetical protein